MSNLEMMTLGSVLRSGYDGDPASIPTVMADLADAVGASDAVVYLVDFAQTTLSAVPANTAAALPPSEDVATTLPGRAFLDQRAVSAERNDEYRVWVPIVEGSNRAGVLALSVPNPSQAMIEACEELGMLAGYLIATHARYTDLYDVFRRRQRLSLAASMQWDLLPPLLLKTRRLCLAALIEPAYDIGGDCFDYALNEDTLSLALFDPVGHGLQSALVAALTVGSFRHDRRDQTGLEEIHEHLDQAIERQFPDTIYTTGQLAHVDLASGVMHWTNAGHPCPMLVRDGRVVRELECRPTLPWGLASLAGDPYSVTVAREQLQPGDGVLFFTDGVVEGRTARGEPFGTERLADLVGQIASDLLEPEAIVRYLLRTVLEHQQHQLRDDATVVLFRWKGPRGTDTEGVRGVRPSRELSHRECLEVH